MTANHAPRAITGWMRTSQKEDVEGQIFRLQLELNEIKEKMHNLRIENTKSYYRQEFAKIYKNINKSSHAFFTKLFELPVNS